MGLRIGDFRDFVERINHEGILIKKGVGVYQVNV
jgi:hypothetical protein